MPVNPFAISEDQCSVADTLRRLLEDSNDFASRRARLDAVEPDRMALWPAFAEQGVIAAAFDEGLGGFAGDARTIAVIMAEMGPALVVEPYLATAVVAGHAIGHWTDRNAARAASEAIIEGRRVYLLAHDCFETVHGPYVTARRSADTNTLTGTIPAVRHGELAHAFLVPARTDDGSVEFYWVEREHPGLHVQPYRLIDAAGGANLRFEDVRLSDSAAMRFDVPAQAVWNDAMEWGSLGLAAEVAGILGSLNAATFSYLMTRKQFGVAIGTFQALQHRAADMWIAAEELMAIVDLAIESMRSAPSVARTRIVSAMRAVANKSGRRVGNDAVQLHGGMGVSEELIVSHSFRRLAAARIEMGADAPPPERIAE